MIPSVASGNQWRGLVKSKVIDLLHLFPLATDCIVRLSLMEDWVSSRVHVLCLFCPTICCCCFSLYNKVSFKIMDLYAFFPLAVHGVQKPSAIPVSYLAIITAGTRMGMTTWGNTRMMRKTLNKATPLPLSPLDSPETFTSSTRTHGAKTPPERSTLSSLCWTMEVCCSWRRRPISSGIMPCPSASAWEMCASTWLSGRWTLLCADHWNRAAHPCPVCPSLLHNTSLTPPPIIASN